MHVLSWLPKPQLFITAWATATQAVSLLPCSAAFLLLADLPDHHSVTVAGMHVWVWVGMHQCVTVDRQVCVSMGEHTCMCDCGWAHVCECMWACMWMYVCVGEDSMHLLLSYLTSWEGLSLIDWLTTESYTSFHPFSPLNSNKVRKMLPYPTSVWVLRTQRDTESSPQSSKIFIESVNYALKDIRMKRSIKTKTNTLGVLHMIKVCARKGFRFPHCLVLYQCTWVRWWPPTELASVLYDASTD